MSHDIDIPDCAPESPEEFSEAIQQIRNLRRQDEEKQLKALMLVEFIRPEILAFAEQMEKTMRKHDPLKGDSWKTCETIYLYGNLEKEMKELDNEFYHMYLKKSDNRTQLCSEIVDVANVSMMLWNREIEEPE